MAADASSARIVRAAATAARRIHLTPDCLARWAYYVGGLSAAVLLWCGDPPAQRIGGFLLAIATLLGWRVMERGALVRASQQAARFLTRLRDDEGTPPPPATPPEMPS